MAAIVAKKLEISIVSPPFVTFIGKCDSGSLQHAVDFDNEKFSCQMRLDNVYFERRYSYVTFLECDNNLRASAGYLGSKVTSD